MCVWIFYHFIRRGKLEKVFVNHTQDGHLKKKNICKANIKKFSDFKNREGTMGKKGSAITQSHIFFLL